MAYRWNLIVACSSLVLSLGLAGCNKSQPPAAAIGDGGHPAPTQGDARGSAKALDQHPVVVIETTKGNITVRLDKEKAPLTVANFLQYVNEGQYDQTIVHQIYKGQVFLAGGYDVNFVEKPHGTTIRNEADNGLLNRRGAIAMARTPDNMDSALLASSSSMWPTIRPWTKRIARPPKATGIACSAK